MNQAIRISLDQIGSLNRHDLLITCLSFDPRVSSTLKAIAADCPAKVLAFSENSLSPTCVVTPQPSDAEGMNASLLKQYFGEKLEVVSGFGSSPLYFADAASVYFGGNLHKCRKIVIDITSFSTELLLILLRMLQIMTQPETEILFLYVTAEEYTPKPDPEKKWLTRGVTEVRAVLGYAGEIKSSKDTHLVIMSGLEVEPALALINYVEPSHVSIGHSPATSSVNEHIALRNREVADAIQKSCNAQNDTFEFSSIDPAKTCNALEAIITSLPKATKIIAAPLNTKMSSIGLFMMCQKRMDVQVQCVRPAYINSDNYCTPGGDVIIFQMEKNGEVLL